jgi:hypothetical protein
MAIDPDKHVIDPETGFALDRQSGRPVGLVPPPALRTTHETEYPKWVEPHASQVVRQGDNVVTPGFATMFLGRDGVVTVLVADADEEERALSDLAPPAADPSIDEAAGDGADPAAVHIEPAPEPAATVTEETSADAPSEEGK